MTTMYVTTQLLLLMLLLLPERQRNRRQETRLSAYASNYCFNFQTQQQRRLLTWTAVTASMMGM